MTTTVFVVLLVVAILGVQVLIWIPIILWFRRRSRAVATGLIAEIAAEGVIRQPVKGVYRGATAPGYPSVRNNGLIALTRNRLVFRTLTGKAFDVPLDSITGLREATVFNRSAVGGREHLIIGTPSGEIGFYVPDNSAWIASLSKVAPHL